MTRSRPRQSGFAMITAIFLMSLVTMTMTVLIAAIVTDARRTQSQSEDAELRQLLLAGTQIAQTQLPASITQPGNIPVILPALLNQSSADLTIKIETINSPTDVLLEIEATLPHHHLTNHVHLTRATNRWQIADSTLG